MKEDSKLQAISLEELEGISGGLVVADTDGKFWLVRENGTVIAPIRTEDQAVDFAKAYGVSTRVITTEEYKTRFGRDLSW